MLILVSKLITCLGISCLGAGPVGIAHIELGPRGFDRSSIDTSGADEHFIDMHSMVAMSTFSVHMKGWYPATQETPDFTTVSMTFPPRHCPSHTYPRLPTCRLRPPGLASNLSQPPLTLSIHSTPFPSPAILPKVDPKNPLRRGPRWSSSRGLWSVSP